MPFTRNMIYAIPPLEYDNSSILPQHPEHWAGITCGDKACAALDPWMIAGCIMKIPDLLLLLILLRA